MQVLVERSLVTDSPAKSTAKAPSESAYRSRITRSALWAAWGDALGFPTELVNPELLERRLDGRSLGALPFAWPRRVGGRMGPVVKLPAGAYSDDTQLRLAVGRCVRAAGQFDVEAFSKIELSVFLAYQLGAGRGTKTAAQELSRRGARWYMPFFDKSGSRYVDGGGNGAAMRIQPHVWSSPARRPETYLPSVVRDTVVTHGHPRALVGSMLHALCLGTALHEREVAGPHRWAQMGRYLQIGADLVLRDQVLADRWMFEWERRAQRSWSAAFEETVSEVVEQLEVAASMSERASVGEYLPLVRDLGGLDPRTRGSGTTSAVLALWVAWRGQADAESALRNCAGLLGSDTDTVATMAGALLGAVADDDPPGPIQDEPLIRGEAARLAALREGHEEPSFPHPDPLRWQPPASLADALGLGDGKPHVAGLGPAKLVGSPQAGQGKTGGLWQWVQLEFGQTLLIKRRPELSELLPTALPLTRRAAQPPRQESLLDTPPVSPREAANKSRQRSLVKGKDTQAPAPVDVDEAVRLVLRSGMNPDTTTRLLVEFAAREDGPYLAGLFAYRLAETMRRSLRDSES